MKTKAVCSFFGFLCLFSLSSCQQKKEVTYQEFHEAATNVEENPLLFCTINGKLIKDGQDLTEIHSYYSVKVRYVGSFWELITDEDKSLDSYLYAFLNSPAHKEIEEKEGYESHFYRDDDGFEVIRTKDENPYVLTFNRYGMVTSMKGKNEISENFTLTVNITFEYSKTMDLSKNLQ